MPVRGRRRRQPYIRHRLQSGAVETNLAQIRIPRPPSSAGKSEAMTSMAVEDILSRYSVPSPAVGPTTSDHRTNFESIPSTGIAVTRQSMSSEQSAPSHRDVRSGQSQPQNKNALFGDLLDMASDTEGDSDEPMFRRASLSNTSASMSRRPSQSRQASQASIGNPSRSMSMRPDKQTPEKKGKHMIKEDEEWEAEADDLLKWSEGLEEPVGKI